MPSKKLLQSEVEERLKSTGIRLVGEYTYTKSKVELLCPYCDNSFYARVSDIFSGKQKSCGCYKAKQASIRTKKSLVGQKFGRLLVLEEIEERNKSKKILYRCMCDCGNVTITHSGNLSNGMTKSCGCLKIEMENKRFDHELIVGQRFHKWTVLRYIGAKSNRVKRRVIVIPLYLCKCDCGREAIVRKTNLLSGVSQSCGCEISKGEKKIYEILNKYNIKFEQQKKFDNCRVKRCLPFDFYLPNIFLAIEYQGEQHYRVSERNRWGQDKEKQTKELYRVKKI